MIYTEFIINKGISLFVLLLVFFFIVRKIILEVNKGRLSKWLTYKMLIFYTISYVIILLSIFWLAYSHGLYRGLWTKSYKNDVFITTLFLTKDIKCPELEYKITITQCITDELERRYPHTMIGMNGSEIEAAINQIRKDCDKEMEDMLFEVR